MPVEVVPELAYRDGPLSAEAMESALRRLRELGGYDGLLHFHNPTLGKNPSWMPMVNQLAADGQAMLLQIHDFGEDHRWLPGRQPAEHATYYPCGGRIHWLVLHPDDRSVLLAAGLGPDDISVLPNPVSEPVYGSLPRARDGKTRVLYPARGIRRKNLGEFLLLAALAPPTWEFRASLPPIGKAQARHFHRWRRWASCLGINVLLGMGPGDHRPDLVLSTSVREGFGYALAEPWLASVPATGRYPGRWLSGDDATPLPHVPGLYHSLKIPTAWIQKSVWMRAVLDSPLEPDAKELLMQRFNGAAIDFAELPESGQRHVLRRVVADRESAATAIAIQGIDGRSFTPASWLAEAVGIQSEFASRMAGKILSAFSPQQSGETLRGIAERVRTARGGLRGHADAAMVAKAFAGAEHFRFLCLPPP